jgi:hypothetical protein
MIHRRVANSVKRSEASELPRFLSSHEKKEQAEKIRKAKINDEHYNKSTTKKPKKINYTVSCIKCKKGFMSANELTNHYEIHIMVKCNICNATVSKSRLKRHINKAHNKYKANNINGSKNNKMKYKKADNSDGVMPRQRYSRCPICDLLILSSRLSEHRSRVHSNQTHNIKTKSTKTSGKQYMPDKPSSRVSTQVAGTSKALDATYGHHTLRDHGRFGSHASYDNYDDESKP